MKSLSLGEKVKDFFYDKRNATLIILFIFLLAGIIGGILPSNTGYTVKSPVTGFTTAGASTEDQTSQSENNPTTTVPTQNNRNLRNLPTTPIGGGTAPSNPEEPGSSGPTKLTTTTVTSGKSTSVGTLNK